MPGVDMWPVCHSQLFARCGAATNCGYNNCTAAGRWRAKNRKPYARNISVRFLYLPASRSLAVALADHPTVHTVWYPGLSEHPQHGLAMKQMTSFGTVLAFEVGDRDAVSALFDRLQLARVATSLGGPETLVCHPATSTHAGLTADEQRRTGVTDGLVRVSVGLEDPHDVVTDIERALEA